MELTVSLAQHTYTILIQKGALQTVGDWAAALWQPQKIVLVTDENVSSLYSEQVQNSLIAAGFHVTIAAVPAGETSKSLEMATWLYDTFAEAGLTRSDGVIILGGGVVGDLGAFAASTYMRGIHFLQIPTSLVAQVDSSIGGKTAVNTQTAKNLVGTFTQPDGVLIDPLVLNTLPLRRVREGIAEIIKTAAIADTTLWSQLADLKDEADLLRHSEAIIYACCEVKRRVVEQDPFDHQERLTLNFGHTIGHALENTAGYGEIAHGEGVALGMIQISRNAEKRGEITAGLTQQLTEMIQKFHLPTEHHLNKETLYQALTHDKKARGNQIKIILVPEIGRAIIQPIPLEMMRDYIEE
ncbi:3-dehydroquinate synthase [Enterococcus canis]|uniref:3-dehydroquinate synthase n=1 Tax=Enterococcus canis TaxID=214095 RepID=A0A1L8RHQ7_9ENTE|nr:3-dehydroquinate synthase [Enterococcus canis]OJG19298.1 3-dehydroquinate synthase [Enterococcus canis]